MSATLENQNPVLKEVYGKMAGIPPQFMKGKAPSKSDPKGDAKKKAAAARLAKLKGAKSGGAANSMPPGMMGQ